MTLITLINSLIIGAAYKSWKIIVTIVVTILQLLYMKNLNLIR